MKGPSLQKTAVISAGLHLTFFLLSFLILRQSRDIIMPSPYTVSLVGPSGETQKRGVAAEPSEPLPAKKNQTTTRIDNKKEMKTIEESIAALKAKREKEKQLEKILALRKALVSIQGKGGQAPSKSTLRGTASGASIGPGEASYIDNIRGQIQKHWEVPDFFRNKDLEAIVSVKIGRDGTLTVQGFEKKSGNRFYDRYVMETIQKASPVTHPLYEMEIGMRFSPKD